MARQMTGATQKFVAFALAARDAIAERMTAEQVAKGQQMAWDWRPEPGNVNNIPSGNNFSNEVMAVPEEPVDETTIARIHVGYKAKSYI